MTASELDARYGRTPARRTRARWFAIVVGIGVAGVVGAWLAWAGVLSPAASLESKDVGFETLADGSVEVRWQLTATPGTAVSCAVQAVSEKHAVIGWKVVEVPPSEERTRRLTETLRTSEPAVGGSVYRCWAPAEADALSAAMP